MRSSYAIALATTLANSVLGSQASQDAAVKAAAQSRMQRMRRADDDAAEAPGGTGGDDSKIRSSKSIRGRLGAAVKDVDVSKPKVSADAGTL